MSIHFDYKKLLNNPKWKKKRQTILKRDGFKCTVCGSKENLHIHHTYYVWGIKPWCYPNISLITVCEECHHQYHLYNEDVILKKLPKGKNKHILKKKPPPKVAKTKKEKGWIPPIDYFDKKKTSIKRKILIDGKWVVVITDR